MQLDVGLTFTEEDKKCGHALVEQGRVRHVIFSVGTYQIEVIDETEYWIFLQVNEEGRVSDQFCTCEAASNRKTCPHLAAGVEVIFGKHKEPIHVRFRSSLWNALFQIAARRHGYETSVIQKIDDEYACFGESGEKHFLLKPLTQEAKALVCEWIDDRKEETEETSLKFSNLDPRELEQWRRGFPSHQLKYELSFWSDLAKWLMIIEDRGISPKITFDSNTEELPRKVLIDIQDVCVEVTVTEANFSELIEPLSVYETELKIFEFDGLEIEKISYDSKSRTFSIDSNPISLDQKVGEVIDLGKWIFRKGVGFFSKETDSSLKKKKIPEKEVNQFLKKHSKMLEKYLVSDEITLKSVSCSYHLEFDNQSNLHIVGYVFEPGDLTKPLSFFFDPWAYVDGRGFVRLTGLLFDGVEKVVPKEFIPEFIEKNRHWLNKYDEFQIHLTNIEAKLSYRMEGDRLIIDHDESHFDTASDVIDFGAWLYIKGQGFYSRGKGQSNREILLPQSVEKHEISMFIQHNREELEQIRGFFHADPGLEKTGLIVGLSDENQILIEPRYTFKEWAKERHPKIFGDFVFIPEKGFAEIADTMKIPAKFSHRQSILADQIPYFLKHELKRIKPYILHMDSRLMEPHKLRLKVKSIKQVGKKWSMNLVYASSFGEVDLFQIHKALSLFSPFVLSKAGMITLKEKRFQWIMRLPKNSFDPQTLAIELTTLDWIRLSIFEEVELFTPTNEEESKMVEVLSSLQGVHMSEMPNIKGLKSKLRPYQEIGVRWLWFLYTYGLSGFLCDEMGLGKTHQAMGLLAAVLNNKKKADRQKFLVVCPTSVIYHWQELLENFLPKVRVHLYHGPFRSPKKLKLKFDVILTTYGIMRSDKELFNKMAFEVAIFDEMQVAKNRKSQIHATLMQTKSEMKLALTGTPLENYLSELKALFDVVLPGFMPTSQEFKEEYVLPIEKNGDKDKQKALQSLISPFILRRKKQDVLDDLPEKIEEIVYIDLSEEQKQIYDEIATRSKDILDREGGEFYIHVFALLNHLKQVCDHPALFKKDAKNYKQYQSGKWDFFVELIEEARQSKQKIVVFSQYLGMLDIMEDYLKENNIKYATIRGSTRDRREQMKYFQEDPTCEVFIGSLQAAGVGIDLTAASVVVHYDRWWNPAKENQATDRVHRIGQNRGVSVFKLVCKNSIEEHIHALIERKKDLISSIVGFDSENEMKKLDKDELKRLLAQIISEVL